MKKTNKGQAALVMILIIAMAFIFYAIELNWGKVANLKITTWMAATSSSAQIASSFASYGERVLQETLLPSKPCKHKLSWNGGNIKCEQDTLGWFLELLVIIVVVVITILTWGSTSYLIAIAIAVMMVAAAIIDYCVIRPMEFSIWNKLQQNLTISNQFQEQGISSGLQTLVTDTAVVPDRFDWDGNGRWGFESGGLIANGQKPKDTIGRYSLFYTERLKLIKPPDTSIYGAFRKALDNLINYSYSTSTTVSSGLGFDPYCTDANNRPGGAPQCFDQCTGPDNRVSGTSEGYFGLGRNYNFSYTGTGAANTITPGSAYVPPACLAACTSTTCPAVVDSRPLIYDPSLEKPPLPAPADPGDQSLSFRYRLGHDDEIGKSLNTDFLNAVIATSNEPGYDRTRAQGIVFSMLAAFPFLEQGYTLKINPILSPVAQSIVKAETDSVRSKNTTYHFWATPDNDCSQTRDSATGFYWKKGADQYCSAAENNSAYALDLAVLTSAGVATPAGGWGSVKHWPYNDCTYMHDNSGNPKSCASGTGNLWPQDNLDDLVYKLSALIVFDQNLSTLSDNDLAVGVKQWYSQMASFIAPQCSVSACQSYLSQCQQSCAGDTDCKNSCECVSANYGSPTAVDSFVAKDPSMSLIYPYADDPSACNSGEQGSMIQWVYDLNNWANKLSNATKTGWLDQNFTGNATLDLCPGNGKLTGTGSVTDCLSKKSLYDTELNLCKNAFVVNACTAAGCPALDVTCVNVVRFEQADETVAAANKTFSTHFPDYKTYALAQPGASTDSPIPPPAPAITDTTPYILNPNAYFLFMKWLNDNIFIKDAVSQRYTLLNSLSINATGSLKLFKEGAADFLNFLNGPGTDLMTTVGSIADTSIKRLPGMAIYAWKDNKTYTVGGVKEEGGMWHIARMEVKSKHQVPWVKSWQHSGFLKTKTYYQLTDGNHDVFVRATRWDQDKTGGAVKFNNTHPIWQYVWGNLKSAPGDAILQQAYYDPRSAIENYCLGSTSNAQPWGIDHGFGLTKTTKDAFNNGTLTNPPPIYSAAIPDSVERNLYGLKNAKSIAQGGALMIDIDPRVTIPAPKSYTTSYCRQAHPVSSSYTLIDNSCTQKNYFTACCGQGIYGFGQNGWGYYEAQGLDKCVQQNQAVCNQNLKNKDLFIMKTNELQCFQVVDYLLTLGVSTTMASRYGVPQLCKDNANNCISGITPDTYHEQVKFYSAQDAQSGNTKEGFTFPSDGSTILDSDIFTSDQQK
jgi:hypothetical protein